MAAKLAKQFEPILLFHRDESFGPIDPKWYLERCALWRTTSAFDAKTNWQQPPAIAKRLIAAEQGANEIAGGKTWIGAAGADFGIEPLPQGEAPPETDLFLEFLGWEPIATPPVTARTNNRHPTLAANAYTASLQGSQPWYYVEYFDHTDIVNYTSNPNLIQGGLNLFQAIANNPALNAPQMLTYHLLYPLHQEALEGCEKAGEGDIFGAYAGEWACIALLLDGADTPTHIGMTSRNTGGLARTGPGEPRLGLTVYRWQDIVAIADGSGGLHPKVFVSLGTHGHYPAAGPQMLTPFTPGGVDPSRSSCGTIEELDGAISGETIIPGTPDTPGRDGAPLIVVTKIVGGSLLGGLAGGIFGAVGGLVTGIISAGDEAAYGSFGATGTPDTTANPTAQPTDVTGGPDYGLILRPAGLALPEAADAATVVDWNVRHYTAPAPDKRAYDFVINRAQQPWWAPRPTPRPRTADLANPDGYSGRWGPRVTNDPNSRRAGGKLPDFASVFLEAVTVKLNGN